MVTTGGTPRARTGRSALSHRAAIFFSPEVSGWTPPAWLSASPSYPRYWSTITTGDCGVERDASPAISRFRASIRVLVEPTEVGMICATRIVIEGFRARSTSTIPRRAAIVRSEGTPRITSFVPRWTSAICGGG